MPLYDYACACGKTTSRMAGMGKAKKKVRCVCGRMARRAVTVPHVRTETMLSDRIRRSYAFAGHRVESWKDVKRLEKEGKCVLTNRHDDDVTDRRRSSALRDFSQDIEDRVRQLNRVEVSAPKRKRKRKATKAA